MVVQNAIRVYPVFDFFGLRFGIAGILMLGLVGIIPHMRRHLFVPRVWLIGLWLGLWLFAGYALQTVGLLFTTPAKSGFITGLTVVLVPIFSLLVTRQRLPGMVWGGVALAAIGLFLLSYAPGGGFNLGDFLTLLSAVAFAVQIVAVGKYAAQYAAMPVAAVQIVTVGILSFAAATTNSTLHAAFTSVMLRPAVWQGLLITILFATMLAYYSQMVIQKFTTPTRTALIFATEPVFAALTAYWWAGNRLTAYALVGASLILLGMVMAELRGNGHAEKAPEVS